MLQCLTRVAYEILLAEADTVSIEQVQDVLRWSTDPTGTAMLGQCTAVVWSGALSRQEVAAVLQLVDGAVALHELFLPQLP